MNDKGEKMKKEIEEYWDRGWDEGIPFPAYELTNNNAKIKRTKTRLEKLEKVKRCETTEQRFECIGINVKENVKEMRIQLFFEGKPNQEIRNILKKRAFKWSPRNGCWQRQLTDNARYATKKVIEQIKKLQATTE